MSDRNRINFEWLLRLRWGAIAGQLVVLTAVGTGMNIDLPVSTLATVILLEIVSNAACFSWARRTASIQESASVALLALDVAFLTVLLHLTGGPFNPFSFWYLVHVALAAVVLPAGHAWSLAALSIGGFGVLFILRPIDDHGMHTVHFDLHIRGMWVAFAIAAAFIVYFVQRVTGALALLEADLAAARELNARHERLSSLATLAAGAAHELATPLSTIAVVTGELQRHLRETGDDERLEDALLIGHEVARCRRILTDMAAGAGENPGEALDRVSVCDLLRETVGQFPEKDRIRLVTPDRDGVVRVPPRTFRRCLRGLIDNALLASHHGTPVDVSVNYEPGRTVIEVRDAGAGMPPAVLAHVGEPFFTTREPGRGMGLGVFLARTLVERLGGTFELTSSVGTGTSVRIRLIDDPCDNSSH